MYAIRARRRESGLSIAIALLVLLVVAVIGLAIAAVGTQNLTLANADRNQQMAKYGAEAGVSQAMLTVKATPDINAGRTNVQLIAPAAMPTSPTVSYRVYVTNNYGGSSTIVAKDGTQVPAGHAYLLGEAIVGNQLVGTERYPLAQRTVGAMLEVGQASIFKYAAFGIDGVVAQGTSSYTDSWDSSEGDYASTQENSDSDLGTNATTEDAVEYTGGATNYGDVWIGPGGDAATVVDGSGYTGDVNVLGSEVNSTPKSAPTGLSSGTSLSVSAPKGSGFKTITTLTPGQFSSLSTASQTKVILTAGTYYFTGNVTLGSQNSLVLPASGEVKVYIDGSWDSQGGTIVNSQHVPSTFQIYGTSSSGSIQVTGGNDAYFVVFAPTADVTVQGNAAVYGALVGQTVTIAGNGQIHYDRDLTNFESDVIEVSLKGWRR